MGSLLAGRKQGGGFTLIELLVVIAIIGILASLLLAALAGAKAQSQGAYCLNNVKQLALSWMLYADDNNGRLPNNFGGLEAKTNSNWVADLLDWDLTTDNTNFADLTQASLGAYNGHSTAAYHCPADSALSSIQRSAGWQNRVRSYSLNASLGDAGQFTSQGYNVNNPEYVQFFKYNSIPSPSEIFVFLDEHPDSIYDGYFVNRAYSGQWLRLPASFHGGAGCISFADGHAGIHKWLSATTKLAPVPDAAALPISVGADTRDFRWVIRHMSVED
jgi:prepilin-type N-terminal cleavage/methylation domain-containing protein